LIIAKNNANHIKALSGSQKQKAATALANPMANNLLISRRHNNLTKKRTLSCAQTHNPKNATNGYQKR